MRGKREAKGQMSRQLVSYCIAVLTVAALWGGMLKSIRPEVDLTDVLTFVGAAFGGELLLLLLKRVLAKEKTNREEKDHEGDCEEDHQP